MTLYDSGTQLSLDVEDVYRIPGMMWPSEVHWLGRTFSESDLHLEIGSYCGRSLLATARGMKSGTRIISVDPMSYEFNWLCKVFKATRELIETLEIQVNWWQQYSVDAMRTAKEKSLMFDSIFIDGNHHFAEVKADIEGWLPFIKPGGIISGHDFWPQDSGVMTAVHEVFDSDFEIVPNTRIWWKRICDS